MVVGLYVRVSTQEQRKFGLSVANQIDDLVKYCKDNGYDYIVYDDAGISARKKYTRRPALLRLIEDVKQGKIDLIMFTRLDRWFRSVADYYAVNSVLEEYNVPWKALLEDYNTQNAEGILKVNIMLSVSQAEADRTSEKIRTVMAYKVARGDYVGSAPIGYILRGRDLLVDEGCKDAMQAFWDTLYETKSLTKARQAAKEHGLLIHKEHAYKIIRRPVYAGTTVNDYQCFAYISPEHQEEILRIVASHTRESKDVKLHHYFSGLCVCGVCGHRMYAKRVRRVLASGEEKYYKKYVCSNGDNLAGTCPSLNVAESIIESFLLANMEQLLDNVRVNVLLTESESRQDTETQRESIKRKLGRLKILFEEGDIDIMEYRTKRDRLKEEITSLSLVEEVHTTVPTLPDYWRTIYESLDEQHRSEFWHGIIDKIVITNETKGNPLVFFR